MIFSRFTLAVLLFVATSTTSVSANGLRADGDTFEQGMYEQEVDEDGGISQRDLAAVATTGGELPCPTISKDGSSCSAVKLCKPVDCKCNKDGTSNCTFSNCYKSGAISWITVEYGALNARKCSVKFENLGLKKLVINNVPANSPFDLYLHDGQFRKTSTVSAEDLKHSPCKAVIPTKRPFTQVCTIKGITVPPCAPPTPDEPECAGKKLHDPCGAPAGPCEKQGTCQTDSGSLACKGRTHAPDMSKCTPAAGGVVANAKNCEANTCYKGLCTISPLTAGTPCEHAGPSRPCAGDKKCSGTTVGCPAYFPPRLTGAAGEAPIHCRAADAAKPCDAPDFCKKGSAECVDSWVQAEDKKMCGSAVPTSNPCAARQMCDGTSGMCPAGFRPAGPVKDGKPNFCRPAAGDCDVPEVCPAHGYQCGEDIVKQHGVVCRKKVHPCDQEEVCDGHSKTCGPDVCINNIKPLAAVY